MEMKAKTVKLFIPHAEIKIFVTDEMLKDFKECQEEAKRDPVPGEELELKQCSDYSWFGCHVYGDFGLCEIPALIEKMNELIREGE